MGEIAAPRGLSCGLRRMPLVDKSDEIQRYRRLYELKGRASNPPDLLIRDIHARIKIFRSGESLTSISYYS